MSINKIAALALITLALGYLYLSFSLPLASLGRAYEPKIFPLILGFSLLILAFLLFLSKNKEKFIFIFDTNTKKITLTLLNCLFYAFIFAKIGYVFATFLFLALQLFIFGGFKEWKKYILIALSFSLLAFVLFDKLLAISLPKSALGFL